jgi:hypothetical protein
MSPCASLQWLFSCAGLISHSCVVHGASTGGVSHMYFIQHVLTSTYYPPRGLIVPLFAGKRGTIIQGGGDGTVLHPYGSTEYYGSIPAEPSNWQSDESRGTSTGLA